MKFRNAVVFFAVLLCACSRNPQASAPTPKAETPEPLKATVWTDRGELYLEYPALIAGQKERFAIHLTRLADFKAVKDARCEVHLTGATPEVFPCDPSTHPGIFGANVEPKSAGEARLTIVVQGKDLNETFHAGAVKIAADAASAEKPAEPKEETIAFSKEQQWALDFGTQVSGEQTLRDNLRVGAETLPRTGGEAAVVAPIAGRIVAEKIFPVGTPIKKGAELVSVVPPTSAVGSGESATRRKRGWHCCRAGATRSRPSGTSACAGGRSCASRGRCPRRGGYGAGAIAGCSNADRTV